MAVLGFQPEIKSGITIIIIDTYVSEWYKNLKNFKFPKKQ